jgi:hypothetical protein
MSASAHDQLMALLDRIDPARYDVEEVVRKLNEFNELTDVVQDDEDQGVLGYAGVEAHPLTALCGEAHNGFFVLRDLTGELEFVWETDTRLATWDHGVLFQGHFSEPDRDWFLEQGVSSLRSEFL